MKSTRLSLNTLLIIFTLITFFANIDALPTDIMEQRNIVTAREMATEGHWLIPTMNGDLRLEKPPLPTWVAGIIYVLRPNVLATQRMAAGLMGCLWTWFMFLTARYLARRIDYAIVATVVFLTCYNTILMGRSATWDIYCHAFMMGAIYLLLRSLSEDCGYSWRLTGAGVLMGLSFLSKGPVSFYTLLLPFLLSIATLPTITTRGKWRYLGIMVFVAVIVGGWWYAYLWLANDDAIKSVMSKETSAWSNHNVRPIWYYWRYFLEMGAWALPALAAWALPYWKHHISLKRTYLITFCWALGSFVLLSIMPEKKMRYLLPSLAPCSLLVACLLIHLKDAFNSNRSSRVERMFLMAQGSLLTIVIIGAGISLFTFSAASAISMPTRIVAGLLMTLVAGITIWSTANRKPMVLTAVVAATFAIVECLLLPVVSTAVGNPQSHNIAHIALARNTEKLPLYHDQRTALRIELVYNAQRKISPINLQDSDMVRRLEPFLLVVTANSDTSKTINLPESDTLCLGFFDNNLHPKGNRHYTNDLRGRVLLVEKRHTNK